MIKIRLARGGAKKKPFYFIVATDSRKRRDSAYIEKLGYFNPTPSGADKELEVDMQRVGYWQSQGAHLSQTVHNLLAKQKNN